LLTSHGLEAITDPGEIEKKGGKKKGEQGGGGKVGVRWGLIFGVLSHDEISQTI